MTKFSENHKIAMIYSVSEFGIEVAIPFLEEGFVVKARQENYGGFLLAQGEDVYKLIDTLELAKKS